MKLYHHPASTVSRTVMPFAAGAFIPLEMQVVDLSTGEHTQPACDAINPSHLIPMLEDGNFRPTESSAIRKYLADKTGSPLCPQDLQQRARVNERKKALPSRMQVNATIVRYAASLKGNPMLAV